MDTTKKKVRVKFLEDQIIFECSISNIKSRSALQIGDIRNVRWVDDILYKAKILKIEKGYVNVKFLCDKTNFRTVIADVEDFSNLQKGDVRQVKWTNGRFYAARIIELLHTEDTPKDTKKSVKTSKKITKNQKIETATETNDLPSELIGENSSADIKIAIARPTQALESETNLAAKEDFPVGMYSSKSTFSQILYAPENDIQHKDCSKEESFFPMEFFYESSEERVNQSVDTQVNNVQDCPRYFAFDDVRSSSAQIDEYSTNTFISDAVTIIANDAINKNTETIIDEIGNNDDQYSISDSTEYDVSSEYIADEENTSSESSASYAENYSEESLDFDTTNEATTDINDTEDTIQKQTNPKGGRQKDFCFYCEVWVSTFSRHIERNHFSEMEVIEIMSKPKTSKERKILLSNLRKKGNYIAFLTGEVRAVRKPTTLTGKPLPCTYCYGLYARKQLWRHRKNCVQNPDPKNKGTRSQSMGQALILKDFKCSRLLREKVFNRMRVDEISDVVQKDKLICAYGSRYLLTHRKAHQYTVCSRKMRELARLLIRIKQMEPKIKNLLLALRPQNFDYLVEGARQESGHDAETDKYKAPTYGMNIGTTLKECCEIAVTQALKRKFSLEGKSSSELEAELRTTILLIKSNWNVEVSHQASNCLSTNKMNKVTIVPLASDIKIFRDYLINEGNELALKLLADAQNLVAFKTLTEIIYCRVLLLCRKRVGELQRLTLELYESVDTNRTYEEFQDLITPTELILIKKFKRVVIQGKRKVTPVLFTPDVQDHIALLTSLRSSFVLPNNPYLFANTSSENPIVGYKVLQSQAKKAGVKQPEAFRSRMLRRHIATVSQLFHMSNEDVEQLATFMGHTPGIHRQDYRLPDDMFQTSKIAKLLLAMESGQGAKFKGKPLSEIDIDLDGDLLGEEYQSDSASGNEDLLDDILDSPQNEPQPSTSGTSMKTLQYNSSGKVSKRKQPTKRILTKWLPQEKIAVVEYFKNHIKQKQPPKRSECEELMKKHPHLFSEKTWLKMKVFVQNVYTNKTKMPVK